MLLIPFITFYWDLITKLRPGSRGVSRIYFGGGEIDKRCGGIIDKRGGGHNRQSKREKKITFCDIQSAKILLLPPKYEIIMVPSNHSFIMR